jgi:hypothetical protein
MVILGDPAEAEDCAQDSFVKAFQAWKRWRPDAPAEAWIHRIAVQSGDLVPAQRSPSVSCGAPAAARQAGGRGRSRSRGDQARPAESATEDSNEKAARQTTDKTEDGSEVRCAKPATRTESDKQQGDH